MTFHPAIFTPGGARSPCVTDWVDRLAKQVGKGFTHTGSTWTEASFKSWANQRISYALTRGLVRELWDALTKCGAPRKVD